MGVRFVRAYFRFFTALARLTGVLFVLGGAWGLATAGRQAPDDRGLVIIVSLFGLLAGVGLLVASPATPEASTRIFGQGLRKDSTDQRGPDDWQA
ncbi:MAG: hypothetical protein EHM78_05550 [Myxococcaceae bacterium]|nr:MAG: hypothetical protein EHM78_05550 [Myxococcaceae bacterium]